MCRGHSLPWRSDRGSSRIRSTEQLWCCFATCNSPATTLVYTCSEHSRTCSSPALPRRAQAKKRFPRCGRKGCTTRPSLGVRGTKIPLFCAAHAKAGMTNVCNKKCMRSSCTRLPSFGHAGENKPIFCGLHRTDGMVDSAHKKCRASGSVLWKTR